MGLSRLADATIAVVAIVYGFLLTLAGFAGLFGIALKVLVSLSLWRYSYEVLRCVAQGKSVIPAPDIDSMHPFGDFRLVLHFAFFGSLLWLFTTPAAVGGAAVAWVGLAAVVAVFPASAGMMALTSDIAAAFNPKAVVGLIQALGRRYAEVVAVAAVILVVVGALSSLPLPSVLHTLLGQIVGVWALLATFCLVGAAIRAQRDVLDIPGDKVTAEEWQQLATREDWRRQLDLAYGSIRSGLTVEGYRTIGKLLEGDRDFAAHQWVLDEMLRWEEKAHALALAKHFVERLLAAGDSYRALDLTAHLRRFGNGVPLERATVERLAEYARSVGKHLLADDLVARAASSGGSTAYTGNEPSRPSRYPSASSRARD